jgi:hypothetical protein
MITAGTSLLHHRVVEKIGEGGMCSVWRATDAKVLASLSLPSEDHLAHPCPEGGV